MSDLEIDAIRLRRRHEDGTGADASNGGRLWRLTCIAGMTAIMAHRLAQPMTAINALVSSALRSARSPLPDHGKIADSLAKIDKEARRTTEIIRSFTQFAHGGAYEIGTTDLGAVLAGTLARIVDDARHHGVAVTLDVAPDLPRIAADPAPVEQITASLVRNAIDALMRGAGERREISISARPVDDGMIEVAVADTGPGIEPDLVSKIFDPFASDRPDDWGVGLAVARIMIEALGGRIGLKPNSARGAVVAFALPPVKEGKPSERGGE